MIISPNPRSPLPALLRIKIMEPGSLPMMQISDRSRRYYKRKGIISSSHFVVAGKQRDTMQVVRCEGKTTHEQDSAAAASVEKEQQETTKRSRRVSPSKGVHQKNKNEPWWTLLVHKRPHDDWFPYNPLTMRNPPLKVDAKFLKIISWNVMGLRSLLNKKSSACALQQLVLQEKCDIICLQETRIQEKDVPLMKVRMIEGYASFWACSCSRLGYSGTSIISRLKPVSVQYGLGISDHDSEGRLVTVEFDSFYIISCYMPSSGSVLSKLSYRVKEWDPSLRDYMKQLEQLKPLVLAGDLNCAHQEIDIFDPDRKPRHAGFTIEERESFERNFLSNGFVDTFRKQHPGAVAYTFWGYGNGGRKTNKGSRLDYFLVSESIEDKIHDSYTLPGINGSDHCPIGLTLKI